MEKIRVKARARVGIGFKFRLKEPKVVESSLFGALLFYTMPLLGVESLSGLLDIAKSHRKFFQ